MININFDAIDATFFDNYSIVEYVEKVILGLPIEGCKQHTNSRVEGVVPEIPFPVPEYEKERWTFSVRGEVDCADLPVTHYIATGDAPTRKAMITHFNTDGWMAALQYDDKYILILNHGFLHIYTNGHVFRVMDRSVNNEFYAKLESAIDVLDWIDNYFNAWLISERFER